MPIRVEHSVATMNVFCVEVSVCKRNWEGRAKYFEILLIDHVRVIHCEGGATREADGGMN